MFALFFFFCLPSEDLRFDFPADLMSLSWSNRHENSDYPTPRRWSRIVLCGFFGCKDWPVLVEMGVDVIKSYARCWLLVGSLVSCTDSADGGLGCLWLSFLLLGCLLRGRRRIRAGKEDMGDVQTLQSRFLLLNLFHALIRRGLSEPKERKGLISPACLFCTPEAHCSELKRSRGETAGGKILLVEDTEINRMLLRKLFRELNLLFEEAENGQIAVDYFKQGKSYDLVLMDKEMPVMDGHEATRQLRLLGVKTPIVALTGNSLQSDKDMFFKAGANDFKTKPLSRDDLVLLLARYGLKRSPAKVHSVLGANRRLE